MTSRRGRYQHGSRRQGTEQGRELKGEAKEGFGRATDDEELEVEGRTDQA
jgi:uncharacterized protein YjbJ (UPF0337 family)